MTYGRLNDSACNISSHTGSTPSGNEAMHSAAVFRTYGKKQLHSPAPRHQTAGADPVFLMMWVGVQDEKGHHNIMKKKS